MINTFEVTLKVIVHSDEKSGFLDENSIKGLINQGMETIAERFDGLTIVGDKNETSPNSINVQVTSLKVGGKKRNPDTFGTDDIPWGRD
jgi:hypothetical protein